MRRYNIHLIGISEGQNREQGEAMFKAGHLDISQYNWRIPKAKIKKLERLLTEKCQEIMMKFHHNKHTKHPFF